MNKSASILKERGIVATPQRVAVWKFLGQKEGHYCVESVYNEIKKIFPTISLATIYTILETFKNANIVQELNIRKNRICYDTCIHNHHHFLCKNCEKIYDIDIECKNAKKEKICGHKVEDIHGYFYGICKNCLKK